MKDNNLNIQEKWSKFLIEESVDVTKFRTFLHRLDIKELIYFTTLLRFQYSKYYNFQYLQPLSKILKGKGIELDYNNTVVYEDVKWTKFVWSIKETTPYTFSYFKDKIKNIFQKEKQYEQNRGY